MYKEKKASPSYDSQHIGNTCETIYFNQHHSQQDSKRSIRQDPLPTIVKDQNCGNIPFKCGTILVENVSIIGKAFVRATFKQSKSKSKYY